MGHRRWVSTVTGVALNRSGMMGLRCMTRRRLPAAGRHQIFENRFCRGQVVLPRNGKQLMDFHVPPDQVAEVVIEIMNALGFH